MAYELTPEQIAQIKATNEKRANCKHEFEYVGHSMGCNVFECVHCGETDEKDVS